MTQMPLSERKVTCNYNAKQTNSKYKNIDCLFDKEKIILFSITEL